RFKLSWQSAAIQKYDWIGLYSSELDDDSDYIGGNNWQWASNGTSYITNTSVYAGYQARYLRWNYNESKYVCVSKTKPFPNIRISSND
ncbi:MAG: hypothetical protein RSE55_09765, partial [Lachnospiraceae bacterium]